MCTLAQSLCLDEGSQRTTFSATMNHRVAIRADDGEVREFGLTRSCPVAESIEVVNLRVVPAKLAVDHCEIKATPRRFAQKFAAGPFLCLCDFGFA